MKALYTIIRPIVTEKATKLGDNMTYAFYVHMKATKVDVKMAIKEIFGQEAATVRMMIAPAKTRVIKRSVVDKRQEMKKAFVTLKGKKKLDITKVSKESTVTKDGGVKVSKKSESSSKGSTVKANRNTVKSNPGSRMKRTVSSS
ncbi:MAG TPA: 50S ribosomal protein L23 [Candidatus Gracilibacteria bacterium]|nr:50S ribosomal protein L23 [Candidatus Gracilibacteria bacterium]